MKTALAITILTLALGLSAAANAAETKYATIDEAIARGDTVDVQAHLEADPETVHHGKHPRLTPLQQSILRNKPDIAVILIEAGADINQEDNAGRTPLHLAVERQSVVIVKALLEHKARANERDRVGWTPLHHAAAKDSVDVARALLDGGADPSTLSDGGGTALHEAAASGGKQMVELLVSRGVDPSVVSKNGDTAISIARRNKNQAALNALQQAISSDKNKPQ